MNYYARFSNEGHLIGFYSRSLTPTLPEGVVPVTAEQHSRAISAPGTLVQVAGQLRWLHQAIPSNLLVEGETLQETIARLHTGWLGLLQEYVAQAVETSYKRQLAKLRTPAIESAHMALLLGDTLSPADETLLRDYVAAIKSTEQARDAYLVAVAAAESPDDLAALSRPAWVLPLSLVLESPYWLES